MWIIILLFIDMALTAKQLHDMRPLSRHWPLKSKVCDLVWRQGCARRGCRAGTGAPKHAVISVYNPDAHGTESAAGKIPVILTERQQPYSVPAAHRTKHTRRSHILRTVERTASDSHRLTSASPSAPSLYVLNAASLASRGAGAIYPGGARACPLLRVGWARGAQGWSNCKCPVVNYLHYQWFIW